MTQDQIDVALAPWTQEMHTAALREGWCVSHCSGCGTDSIQIQRIDNPDDWDATFDIPSLESDDHAMFIVRTGTGQHHQVARQIVAQHNPEEFQYMNSLADIFAKEI